jgi:hypothetical protein
VSELALDEWAAQELSERESARIAAHVAGCEQCGARHAALTQERVEFLAEAPSFADHAARVTETQRRSQRQVVSLRQRLLLAAGCAATLAASTLLVLWTGGGFEQTRSKGGPHVSWFVKRGEYVYRGRADEPLYPGDSLRFLYSSDAPRYFALLNLDARSASIFYPAAGQAAAVRTGNDIALDFSIELDGQLGDERVYALFCDTPFAIEPLRAVLEKTAALPAPSGCHSDSITLHKVAPP